MLYFNRFFYFKAQNILTGVHLRVYLLMTKCLRRSEFTEDETDETIALKCEAENLAE